MLSFRSFSARLHLSALLCFLCLSKPIVLLATPLSGEALADFFRPRKDDFFIGVHPSKAKVVVVEYGSLTCFHCRNFFLSVLPGLKERFVDREKLPLSIIYRDFVSDGPSMVVVTLLRCLKAEGHKRHQIVANLYQAQSDWAYSSNSYQKIKQVFVAHGYRYEQVDSCVQNQQIMNAIMQEQRDVVEKGGLTGTPMVIVNGRPLADIRPASIGSQIELAFKSTS